MHLLGIDERCVPLSHARPDKSPTSENIMGRILGRRDGCSQ